MIDLYNRVLCIFTQKNILLSMGLTFSDSSEVYSYTFWYYGCLYGCLLLNPTVLWGLLIRNTEALNVFHPILNYHLQSL